MKKATVRGTEIAYQDLGTGPAVLCIHGFPLSHQLWTPIADRLSDRFRFIMPDLRGHGQTAATPTAFMTDYADDLAALLDDLKIEEPVHVMGLSMGGYVAFEFFRRHAARVRSLVLADTQAAADTPEKAKSRSETAAKVLAQGCEFLVDAMLPNLFAADAPKETVNAWRKIMLATDPKGVAAALHAMADRIDSAPTFAQIKVPTLVVVGEHDAITPPDLARVMSDGIPNAKLEVISGAGHMSPVEAPDAYAKIVGDFVDSHDGSI